VLPQATAGFWGREWKRGKEGERKGREKREYDLTTFGGH